MRHTVTLKLTVNLDVDHESAVIAAAKAKHPEVKEGFDLDEALMWLLDPDVTNDAIPGVELFQVKIALAEGGRTAQTKLARPGWER